MFKKRYLLALSLLAAGAATAQSMNEQIVNELRGQGFTRVEIKNGLTQTKVEAIRGTQKLEVVYDQSTGRILSQEVERVGAGDDTAPGVEIDRRSRDFVRTAASPDRGRGTDDDDDDDDDDRDDRRDDDDDDDNDRNDRDDRDDRDDDRNDDRGRGHGGNDDSDDDSDDSDDDSDDDDGDDDD